MEDFASIPVAFEANLTTSTVAHKSGMSNNVYKYKNGMSNNIYKYISTGYTYVYFQKACKIIIKKGLVYHEVKIKYNSQTQ